MLIFGESERLLPWAAERIGLERFQAGARAIGIEDDRRNLRGVVVYDSIGPADCSMHVASDGSARWLTREFLFHVFAYPFIQLGLRRVTAMVPSKNTRAIRFDEKLGFVREGYHPHGMPDDDLVSLGMLREHCRYIPKEHRR